MAHSETLSFACVAEAVAHFYNLGYVTKEETMTSTYRMMHKPGKENILAPMVAIVKHGFLDVKVYFL